MIGRQNAMRNKILIVDDSLFNRQVLQDILKEKYELVEAADGQEALDIIEKQGKEIAAVLLDIVMPNMDGLSLLKILKEKNYMDEFPILMVTGENSFETLAECFKYGASDFIRKPVQKDFVIERVEKLVELYLKNHEYKEKLAKQTLTLRNQYKILLNQSEQLKKVNDDIIEMLGTIVEYRNLENRSHIKKVSGFTEILANYMMKDYPEYELTEEKIKVIVSISVLHDLGKILIKDSVLLKPGKLTPEEKEYVRSHTLRGYEIAESITESWGKEYQKCCCEITRSHHERYDGNGYPDGLKGEEIPISAQIVSLADCYESLISESVYKSAIPYDEAYNKIMQGEKGVFSPKLLECFRKARKELEECADKYSDDEMDEVLG